MNRLDKQQACQLYIEQEIEAGLAEGKTKYSIGHEIAEWVESVFGAEIKPNTIEQRARRHEEELVTNVTNLELDPDNLTPEQKQIVDLYQAAQKCKKDIIKEERYKEIQEIQDRIDIGDFTDLPEGKFETIVIDPPWEYGTGYDSGGRRVASPYPEMSQKELLETILPSADDCVLFLWTTHKFIWDAKELLDTWGFEYRSTIVWDKEKMGMGNLFRMQCEFCLVGIKGNPIFNNDNTHRDIISCPRREHSRKPDEFYKMIDELCVGRKLDYFAREEREGWEVFGCEVE